MFVVLSYYGDSSGQPTLKFFPINQEQPSLLVAHIVSEMDMGKHIEAYELTSINEPEISVIESGPQPQGKHNG